MLATRPPPVSPLEKAPRRMVSTIKLRNSYFGLHLPVGHQGVSEASVLAFTSKSDAENMAWRLALHRCVAKRWPQRVLTDAREFELADFDADLTTAILGSRLEGHGLRIEQEPFHVLVRRLALEDVSLRLVTDLDAAGGLLKMIVYKEKVDIQDVAMHLKSLLRLPSDKH